MIGLDFDRLIRRCKGSVNVNVNPHRDYYKSVTDYLDDLEEDGYPRWKSQGATEQERDRMIHEDRIFQLYVYPRTPVGFFSLIGPDLDALIAKTHKLVDSEGIAS